MCLVAYSEIIKKRIVATGPQDQKCVMQNKTRNCKWDLVHSWTRASEKGAQLTRVDICFLLKPVLHTIVAFIIVKMGKHLGAPCHQQ